MYILSKTSKGNLYLIIHTPHAIYSTPVFKPNVTGK